LELVRTYFNTPLDVTTVSCRPNLSFGLRELTHPLGGVLNQNTNTFFVFLQDAADLSTCCAFWNAQSADSSNKCILPKESIQLAFDILVRLVSPTRRIDTWVVISELDESNAVSLHRDLCQILIEVNSTAKVWVMRSGFAYSRPPLRLRSNNASSITVMPGVDSSVRFIPPKPENADPRTLFGFDAEVSVSSADKLSLPPTIESSVLLSNPTWRIERCDGNVQDLGRLWLRTGFPIRARRDGIAGTLTPEEQAEFYLPSSDELVTRIFRAKNINVEPNRHTRYAMGTLRMLGNLDDALRFARTGGLLVLEPLLMERASQAGLSESTILELLRGKFGIGSDVIQRISGETISRLLSSGLIRRGLALTCPQCDLREWYAIEDLTELVECSGCRNWFQLPRSRFAFNYRVSELPRRLLENGGRAVVTTAAALDAMSGGHFLFLGGNLLELSEKTVFAEIDLVCATTDVLAIVECKDYADITVERHQREAIGGLNKLLDLAPRLSANVVGLGIVSPKWNDSIFKKVVEVAEQAKVSGIAVHLWLNGKLHGFGDSMPLDTARVSFEQLLVPGDTSEVLHSVGDRPSSFGGGQSVFSEIPGSVKRLEGQLMVNPPSIFDN
jgi:hypothetical protein